jgi:hypothetical protein
MTRHILIFAACFLVAAVATAALRTAQHSPYEATVAMAPPAAMEVPAADPHAGHQALAAPAAPAAVSPPVNTICAICGMPVDPKIPSATYRGKVIGFGCKICPAKFAANPELYGPLALENRVVDE